eukprot:13131601-Ditylum_brightwellii.AAC.1
MRDVEEETITIGVLAYTDAFNGLTVGGGLMDGTVMIALGIWNEEKRDEVAPIRLDSICKFKRHGPQAI